MRKPVPAYLRVIVAPLVFYLVAYCVLRFEALQHFSTDFFCDGNDGLQNVWNVWWVSWAVRHGTNPWYTHLLHYPQGTSLVAHTLNPFNGLLGIPLSAVLTPVQTYNTLVIFSFVMGGLTAFWLSLEITGSYPGSLLCGYLFTFSEFHFAHGAGHLQLVALEWLPLFLLAFWRLLDRATPWRGVLAGLCLFLVILCDYYYFLFCVLAGAILLGWHLLSQRKNRLWARRSFVLSLAAFVAVSSVLCGPLLVSLLGFSGTDPLVGAHDPEQFSLDLLGPLVPGGTWRFAEWTGWYWHHLPGNPSEKSVSWGLGPIALMIVAWARRRTLRPWIGLWSFLLACFALLALGPRLQFLGQPVDHLPGPFALLVKLLPPLKLAGAPVRMSVITSLCVAMIAGAGFSILWRSSTRAGAAAVLLLAVAVVGSWPFAQPLAPAAFPPYVAAMQSLSKEYGLFDVADAFGAAQALYDQTAHRIPLAHGYVSRVPRSVAQRDAELDVLAERGQWQMLCERYGFRYLVVRSEAAVDPALETAGIFREADPRLRFYDLGRLWNCARRPVGPVPPPELPIPLLALGHSDDRPGEGAVCTIDAVNFLNPHEQHGIVQLTRDRSINVAGWAFRKEGEGGTPPLRLRLERSDGRSFETPARRLPRPDVADAFHNPRFQMAGLQLVGSMGDLSAGTYRILIVQDGPDGPALCDPKVKIDVP
jgi:hypothetical protein